MIPSYLDELEKLAGPRDQGAITLGLALLIQPVKVHSFLITSMGMFWLVSGVMSIRWGLSGRRARRGLPLLAGIVGVLTSLVASTPAVPAVGCSAVSEQPRCQPAVVAAKHPPGPLSTFK